MLGKLIKDEIKAYCYPGAIVFIIGFIFTIFFKVMTILLGKGNSKSTVVFMAGNTLYYFLLLMVTSVTVISAFRFYKTTISDCGYLTWTLPVKTQTVIWSKLIAAVLFRFVALLLFVVYLVLFEIGNFKDMFQVSFQINNNRDVMRELRDLVSGYVFVLLGLFIIFVILEQAYTLLSLYFSMAVGQLAGKFKILASVGCYIGISILHHIFSFVGMMMLVFSGNEKPFDAFLERNNILYILNKSLLVMCLFIGVANIFYFCMTHYIFKNRLNLD